MSVKASDTAIRLKEVSPVGTAFYPIGSSLRPLRIFLAHFAVKALDRKGAKEIRKDRKGKPIQNAQTRPPATFFPRF